MLQQLNELAKHGAAAGDAGRPDRPDWTIDQNWESYTAEDHGVWKTLFERQRKLLVGRACDSFVRGMNELPMSAEQIPDFRRLSDLLMKRTGWQVVAVPGLVPDDVFFKHLANRRFPAGQFIRKPHELDYLEEPDVFHDVFGHVPLLAQPAVADFMQALGELGLHALEKGALHRLARLYWYTVEFGLAREDGRLKIYGAGILSSFGESHYSLDSAKPHRLAFDLPRVLRTRYRTDAFQQSYFVIDRFEDVLKLVQRNDFDRLYDVLEPQPDLDPALASEEDRLAA